MWAEEYEIEQRGEIEKDQEADHDQDLDPDCHQVASKGIRVNSVNPGVIVTGIFEKAGLTPEQTAEYYEASDQTWIMYILSAWIRAIMMSILTR